MNEEVTAAVDTTERGPAYIAALQRDATRWREHEAKWIEEQRAVGLTSIETLNSLGFMTPELASQLKTAHEEGGVSLIPVIRVAANIASNYSDLKVRLETSQKEKDAMEKELAGLKEKKVRTQPEVSFTSQEDKEHPYLKRVRMGCAEGTKREHSVQDDDETVKAALLMFSKQ